MSESQDEIKAKLRKAITDPLKVRKNDPGRPEVCLVFTYHQKFNEPETPAIDRDCRSGTLGCVDCKMNVAGKIADTLGPFREKRSHYESNMNEVKDILATGESAVRKRAVETMHAVHSAMSLG